MVRIAGKKNDITSKKLKTTPKKRKSVHTRKSALVNDSGVSFATYIYRVSKLVHPELSITTEAMSVMRSIIDYIAILILKRTSALLSLSGKRTVKPREIIASVRLLNSPELTKRAIEMAAKAVATYNTYVQKTKHSSLSSKSGIQFSVSRCKKLIYIHVPCTSGESGGSIRVGGRAAIALAAVLEYFTAELVELAGNAARQYKRRRIKRRHIIFAVRNDMELSELLDSNKIYI